MTFILDNLNWIASYERQNLLMQARVIHQWTLQDALQLQIPILVTF